MSEFHLDRFVAAQARVYDKALAELRRGRKESHWMWFIFPQLEGLGRSPTAQYYGLQGAAEARAYLEHPLLGSRLRECTEAMLAHRDRGAEAILGDVDAMKYRSSMTLFAAVAEEPGLFGSALELFYDGERDPATLRMLSPAR